MYCINLEKEVDEWTAVLVHFTLFYRINDIKKANHLFIYVLDS